LKMFSKKKNPATYDEKYLVEEINMTKAALSAAYANFDNATDPDLIDCYIYQLNSEQYIRYAAMFIIIMMAVIDDYRRFKVSNRIIIAGMVIGVVINMGSLMYGGDVRGYIYGGMAGFAIMYMVYIFGGVGAGDVKLLAVCGLLIGVTYIVRLICAAMVCGVLTGVLENVGVIKGRQGVCIRDNVLIKQGRHTIHRFHYTYALCLGAAIMVVLNIKA
jgi:Flp pilus assembly protein protease CpaA